MSARLPKVWLLLGYSLPAAFSLQPVLLHTWQRFPLALPAKSLVQRLHDYIAGDNAGDGSWLGSACAAAGRGHTADRRRGQNV